MCATGDPPIYVTIVGRGSFGGYAAFEDKDQRRSQTRSELEDHICQLLGGREAERLYYSDGAQDSTGPSNDLEQATRVAEAMVYEFGMSSEIGFVRIDRKRAVSGDLAARCHEAVSRIIQNQSERCRTLLSERREALDLIVQALVDKNRLLKDEVLAIFHAVGEQRIPARGAP
jgi:cell division protease FtsH